MDSTTYFETEGTHCFIFRQQTYATADICHVIGHRGRDDLASAGWTQGTFLLGTPGAPLVIPLAYICHTATVSLLTKLSRPVLVRKYPN